MKPTKIGFVLASNSRNPLPSTRIAVLNMFPFLRAANFDPQIVFEPEQTTDKPDISGLASRLLAEGFRLIYFQKVRGPSVEEAAKQLSAGGVVTVYSICDLIDIGMVVATDATIVVTDYLKNLYPQSLASKIHVVHDGIEHPEIRKTYYDPHRGSRKRPLRAVLVTSFELDHLPVLRTPPEWLKVSIVGRYPGARRPFERLRVARRNLAAQRNWNGYLTYLRFLANRRIQCIAWDPVRVYDSMRQADIGIIPIDTQPEDPGPPPPNWEMKSENRLTMQMSLGLPVIATPIPSYERVVEHGRNGFLARSRRDWIAYLTALRDPACRQAIGDRARQSVLERYSMQKQARRLIEIFRGLTTDSCSISTTATGKVSITT